MLVIVALIMNWNVNPVDFIKEGDCIEGVVSGILAERQTPSLFLSFIKLMRL